MLRLAPPRRRARRAVAVPLLAAALILVGCGGGSDDEGSSSDTTEQASTTAGDETTTTEAGSGARAALDGFADALEGAGFDADQQSCILEVAERGLAERLEPAELDAAYQEACDVTSTEVTAGAYYSALLDVGVDEEAAGCARDLYASLTVEQAADLESDESAQQSILDGCGIDPALLEQG